MSKVKKAFLLKRCEVDIKTIKRGDLFCLELEGQPLGESPDWMVALVDAVPDPMKPGEVAIQADRVYVVVGRPEVVTLSLKKAVLPSA